ncbi:MAG: TIGR03792 family protein [Cyanobacterium sp.]
MVIEWLKFEVYSEYHDFFLEQDKLVWTDALKKYEGFVDKQVWARAENEDEIIFVIRWASRELWKAIPTQDLALIDVEFQNAMGNIPFRMLESREFRVI